MLTIPRYTSLLTEWTAGFASPLRRRSKRHNKLVWLIEYSQLLPKPNPCLPCGLGENIQGILDSFHFLVFHTFCISESLCSPSKTHHRSIYFSPAPQLHGCKPSLMSPCSGEHRLPMDLPVFSLALSHHSPCSCLNDAKRHPSTCSFSV